MFSMFHGIYGHFCMFRPMRSDIDQVHIFPVTKILPGFFPIAIQFRFMPFRGNTLFSLFGYFRPHVTNSLYGHAFDTAHTLYRRRTPVPYTDKTNPNLFHLWGSIAGHIKYRLMFFSCLLLYFGKSISLLLGAGFLLASTEKSQAR